MPCKLTDLVFECVPELIKTGIHLTILINSWRFRAKRKLNTKVGDQALSLETKPKGPLFLGAPKTKILDLLYPFFYRSWFHEEFSVLCVVWQQQTVSLSLQKHIERVLRVQRWSNKETRFLFMNVQHLLYKMIENSFQQQLGPRFHLETHESIQDGMILLCPRVRSKSHCHTVEPDLAISLGTELSREGDYALPISISTL